MEANTRKPLKFAGVPQTGKPISAAKGQIPLRYPGRRQVRSWSQTCSELEFGLSSTSLS